MNGPVAPVSKPPTRVLLIDDEPAFVEFFRMVLSAPGSSAYALASAYTAAAGKAAVSRGEYDIVFIDYLLGDADGLQTLQHAVHCWPEKPAILISGKGDGDIDLAALRFGADDFLSKADVTPRMLDRIIRYATERGQARQALAGAEERFAQFFLRSAAGAIQMRTDGEILAANPSMAEILGCAGAEELVGTRVDQFYVTPSDGAELLLQLQKDQKLRNHELALRNTTGETVWLLANVALQDTAERGGPIIEMTVVDITERRRLEEQFRQSQKMEAVGQLAGGIAHDFNNVLTAILGYAELALQATTTASVRDDILEIRSAGERAKDLTQQLLAFSRRQVLRPQVLDLSATLAVLLGFVPRIIGEDIHLTSTIAPDVSNIKADPSQFDQVLLNLIVNARDAMPEGGQLRIDVQNADVTATEAPVLGTTPGAYVRIAVSDTGTGMSAETLARIFEPFFTTKESGKGTGLGLSTAYGVVKQSGGGIAVSSVLGGGTTFRVYFPAASERPSVQIPPVSVGAVTGGETILIAEDETSVRRLAEQILRRAGYIVLSAPAADQALAIATAHPERIDLLLTDVVMPGDNGAKLAQAIRVLRPEIPVIYMSGYPDQIIAEHGVLASGVRLLSKPFTGQALMQAVRAAIDAAI